MKTRCTSRLGGGSFPAMVDVVRCATPITLQFEKSLARIVTRRLVAGETAGAFQLLYYLFLHGESFSFRILPITITAAASE
eukprot:scaffold3337_cov95-Cylindrotheca_fusiformis.AAC.2